MKKKKQTAATSTAAKSEKSGAFKIKGYNVKVRNIESLDITYDVRDTQVLSIDGALVEIKEGGEARILFYNAPLLKERNVSFVKCPFEIRMSRSVLLTLVRDLLNQTNDFLMKEISETRKNSPNKPPEGMFG
jgi:hypothetical protein